MYYFKEPLFVCFNTTICFICFNILAIVNCEHKICCNLHYDLKRLKPDLVIFLLEPTQLEEQDEFISE
jgi:hypothetical protein